ncbi:MAG: NAD(P)H-dependent glycerol-3-phosphate dehydrogenase [Phycisphaerales bacterium]
MAHKPPPKPVSARSRKRTPHRPTIAVLGIGQMGLVCSTILATLDRGPNGSPAHDSRGRDSIPLDPGSFDVVLWGHNQEEADHLSQARTSLRLPGFRLPESVRVARSEQDAVAQASLIISAIPVQYSRAVWKHLGPIAPRSAAVVSVAKGIENQTLLRPTQVIAECMGDDPDGPPRRLAVLSGPTIAAELVRCLPATMVAASEDAAFAASLQRLFSTSWLRIYTNADVLGVEIAGATKNVIAIAAGILDGLRVGVNAKSALLARGLVEIARLGEAMGAARDTFYGIAGVGDLATSCFSPEGRNRSCGEALGRGVKLADYLKRSTSVVEGVATTRSVMGLSQRFKVDMPITAAVHAVLFEDVDPIVAIGRLMARRLKGEQG